MKKFTVTKLSDETKNGNVIVKLVNKVSVTIAGLGKKAKSETYYIAVDKDELTAKVDDVIELDLDDFTVVEREFEHPEEGEIMLKWLHLK